MKVSLRNAQKDLKFSLVSVRFAIKSALAFHEVTCDEVIVHFVTKEEIASLHADFFDDPSVTDCISFPYDRTSNIKPDILGEIFVCPAVAKDFASKKNLNPLEETTLYLVHGLLHLLGFDDMKSEDKRKMRGEEKKLMRYLTIKNALLKP